ncbi:hypothetical protein LINPERHAP1_LOCUS16116 [Linum perenne]
MGLIVKSETLFGDLSRALVEFIISTGKLFVSLRAWGAWGCGTLVILTRRFL